MSVSVPSGGDFASHRFRVKLVQLDRFRSLTMPTATTKTISSPGRPEVNRAQSTVMDTVVSVDSERLGASWAQYRSHCLRLLGSDEPLCHSQRLRNMSSLLWAQYRFRFHDSYWCARRDLESRTSREKSDLTTGRLVSKLASIHLVFGCALKLIRLMAPLCARATLARSATTGSALDAPSNVARKSEQEISAHNRSAQSRAYSYTAKLTRQS